MIQTRPSEQRGHFDHGRLDTRHTFSFASYHDPEHMGFRTLRVINEDIVAPGQGFGAHPHRDMEIVTYVLEGALQHRDSMGNGTVIRPGEVQLLSAGSGITHSEFNASKAERVHLLQIWIIPSAENLKPGYQQKAFPDSKGDAPLTLLVSPSGEAGSLKIHSDARIYRFTLGAPGEAALPLGAGRGAWVQIIRGEVSMNGQPMRMGDGAAVGGESRLEFASTGGAEGLVFDLA